jgi:hypothetical protein
MTKYVIRKGSLTEELYLQPAGHWGRYDTARRFSTPDKATQCAEQLGIEDYGIFDAGAAVPVGRTPGGLAKGVHAVHERRPR